MRMLLVEDNARLCAALLRGFAEHGLATDAVATGNAALDYLGRAEWAAVILDLGLPDIDGFAVIRAARERGVLAPLLVLSARDAVEERVLALERGADDYLVKPFVFAELLARVRALMRRSTPPRRRTLTLGQLEVERDCARARIGTREVALSPREHNLLQHLLWKDGEVAARREILSTVFGYAFDPGTNLIDVHIAHLRRKLEGADVQIETVRGHGYRLRVSAAAEPSV